MSFIQSPTVEERVVDGGAHGDHVGYEVDEQEVGRLRQLAEVLVRENDHVQRQPAADEDRHHRYQHAVCAPLALYFRLVASAPTTTSHQPS